MHLIRIIVALLLFSLPAKAEIIPSSDFDAGRNRLIAYMLSYQLTSQHFAHKALDDISPAALDLYLRQLDPRKRFLLREDAQELQKFTDQIDEDLRRGIARLPDTAAEIFTQRIREVEAMTSHIFDLGFDPNRVEQLEMDPKKIEYAANAGELRERWRRILKAQILETYLNLLDGKKGAKSGSEPAPEQQAEEHKPGQGAIDQTLWNQAVEKIRERNYHYFRRLQQETKQDHYNLFFDSVAKAYDPHTSYMAPKSKEDFDIHMSGSLEGIGALLKEEDGNIKVVRIIPGSASERQGQLQAEDIILEVAEDGQEPVQISDMRIREAVSHIRGPKGTKVLLTIQKPDGAKLTIPIVRDVVQIEETYIKSEILTGGDGRKIGFIRIPSFYRNFADSGKTSQSRNVTTDLTQELYELDKKGEVKGVILDLRDNGGGSLSDAVSISGLFLPGGPVVQVKDSKGTIKILDDTDKVEFYRGPVIILINKFSASASEILAAALQDYGRALVIGSDHTHGKGTVQTVLDMNRNLPAINRTQYEDLGALKITIQKFYRINGESTQYKGIIPDVVLPTILDHLKSDEKYLDYSLPWDTIESAQFTPADPQWFDREKARQLAAAWVAESPEFKTIMERRAKAMERSSITSIPVYLEGMLKERREIEALMEESDGPEAHLQSPPEDNGNDSQKEALKEQLQKDPYVQLAVYLMEKLTFPKQDTTEGQ